MGAAAAPTRGASAADLRAPLVRCLVERLIREHERAMVLVDRRHPSSKGGEAAKLLANQALGLMAALAECHGNAAAAAIADARSFLESIGKPPGKGKRWPSTSAAAEPAQPAAAPAQPAAADSARGQPPQPPATTFFFGPRPDLEDRATAARSQAPTAADPAAAQLESLRRAAALADARAAASQTESAAAAANAQAAAAASLAADAASAKAAAAGEADAKRAAKARKRLGAAEKKLAERTAPPPAISKAAQPPPGVAGARASGADGRKADYARAAGSAPASSALGPPTARSAGASNAAAVAAAEVPPAAKPQRQRAAAGAKAPPSTSTSDSDDDGAPRPRRKQATTADKEADLTLAPLRRSSERVARSLAQQPAGPIAGVAAGWLSCYGSAYGFVSGQPVPKPPMRKPPPSFSDEETEFAAPQKRHVARAGQAAKRLEREAQHAAAMEVERQQRLAAEVKEHAAQQNLLKAQARCAPLNAQVLELAAERNKLAASNNFLAKCARDMDDAKTEAQLHDVADRLAAEAKGPRAPELKRLLLSMAHTARERAEMLAALRNAQSQGAPQRRPRSASRSGRRRISSAPRSLSPEVVRKLERAAERARAAAGKDASDPPGSDAQADQAVVLEGPPAKAAGAAASNGVAARSHRGARSDSSKRPAGAGPVAF